MRTLSLLAFTTAVTLSDASACGGFFCNQVPVDQTGEQIVFEVDPASGTVEAHVQIAYQGSAEDFAWVVPVPDVPELFLSTDQLFLQLGWQTRPEFQLEYRTEGQCGSQWDSGFFPPEASESDADFGTDADSDGGVVVVAEQTVGPYETVTLQADSSQALLTWLQTHGYDLPSSLTPVLAPYVAGGSSFVALRLQNDRSVGELAPLGMRYQGTQASIPIQLTSIAATPDMRLEVYVFGEQRAVPSNYLHVRINEAAIDWPSNGRNYDDVVTRAANEAGGHAFATDFSGSPAPYSGRLYQEGRYTTSRFDSITDPVEAVNQVINQGFPADGTTLAILQRFVPAPDGVDDQSFYNCVECYQEMLEGVTVDGAAMGAALEEQVVQPLVNAEALFTDNATMSRMTSSLSPVEMTVDPLFVFNPDLGDVARMHEADMVIECGDGLTWDTATRRIELSDGRVIRLPPSEWMRERGLTDGDYIDERGFNAAEIIERTSASGEAEIIVDNRPIIDGAIRDNNDAVNGEFGSGCACDGSGAPSGAALVLLALGGILRRRRSV